MAWAREDKRSRERRTNQGYRKRQFIKSMKKPGHVECPFIISATSTVSEIERIE